LGTDHHEFTFTVQEGIDAIGDVIAHIETYDVTTIRWGVDVLAGVGVGGGGGGEG
jgi:asparagine synthetase B (glutamine-hydrolysing)